eukprot:TRINITY_DN803_c0_g1_i2.p1 TRINITY_DN803_c0_g1~~TRINITY_DN803_c0_g1_i2.p1  ORF type:complete len:468 (-),score=109.82 TRINITY_DN803_c0_g1_i2:99-1502(-)
MKALQGKSGIPTLYWFGQAQGCNALVMDLLGPSLEDLFNLCQRKFSLKTVLMLTDQLIQRVEAVHSKRYIHRDIKPDNFLIGLGKKSNTLYVIDYGLGKKYQDSKTHQHIPYRENKNLTGTARYASVNAHLGIEQSRRDDLEGIGYVIIYLLKGYLPWQGIKANNKQEKYNKIMEKKMSTPVEILCKGLPIEFSTYLNYCRSLRFEDKPDYLYLRKMFKDLFYREGYEWDYVFDWCLPIQGNKNPKYTNGKISIIINTEPPAQQPQQTNQQGAPITLHFENEKLDKDKDKVNLLNTQYLQEEPKEQKPESQSNSDLANNLQKVDDNNAKKQEEPADTNANNKKKPEANNEPEKKDVEKKQDKKQSKKQDDNLIEIEDIKVQQLTGQQEPQQQQPQQKQPQQPQQQQLEKPEENNNNISMTAEVGDNKNFQNIQNEDGEIQERLLLQDDDENKNSNKEKNQKQTIFDN